MVTEHVIEGNVHPMNLRCDCEACRNVKRQFEALFNGKVVVVNVKHEDQKPVGYNVYKNGLGQIIMVDKSPTREGAQNGNTC